MVSNMIFSCCEIFSQFQLNILVLSTIGGKNCMADIHHLLMRSCVGKG